jgi:hypothetical protein
MPILCYKDSLKEPENPTVADQDTLRIYIGLLGFSLPFILPIWLFCHSQYARPLNSISHYYYSRANSAFVITLGVLAAVLLVYKGKRRRDFWLSSTAAVSALLVILAPTNIGVKADAMPAYFITYLNESHTREVIHFVAAGLFLSCLAIMSYVRFPENDSSDEKPKPLDRFMYKFCGVVMGLALAFIFLGAKGILIDEAWFERHQGIFWGEAVAVWFFGYSWLLKARFFRKTLALSKKMTAS